jgi:hypothetical protein
VESPLRREAHGGFGERPGETDRWQHRHRAPGRLNLLAFCDNTGEFLAALLRPGNAGSNTAADHITVLDQALAQIPDIHRHGHPILIRADGAGCTKVFLAHVRSLRAQGVACEFSVGWTITGREHTAIALLRERDWSAAVDTDGEPRPLEEAAVAEITGLLPTGRWRLIRPGRG